MRNKEVFVSKALVHEFNKRLPSPRRSMGCFSFPDLTSCANFLLTKRLFAEDFSISLFNLQMTLNKISKWSSDRGMDCMTASYAGVAGSSPTEKEQKFVPFSFIHNPPISMWLPFFIQENSHGGFLEKTLAPLLFLHSVYKIL